jgi:hypothetical protein
MSGYYFTPNTPILTDQIFVDFGYFTGTSTYLQRQAAYSIAEAQVEQEIGTFLIPKTISAEFSFNNIGKLLTSPVGQVISINSIIYYEKWSNGVERLISGTSFLLDSINGYFQAVPSALDNGVCNGCSGQNQGIYKTIASITAGYSTGVTVTNPTIQLALAMTADIILKQMYDEGIGFEFWTFDRTIQVGRTIRTISDRYLFDTSFGVSTKAQFIRNLLKPYKIHRAGKL